MIKTASFYLSRQPGAERSLPGSRSSHSRRHRPSSAPCRGQLSFSSAAAPLLLLAWGNTPFTTTFHSGRKCKELSMFASKSKRSLHLDPWWYRTRLNYIIRTPHPPTSFAIRDPRQPKSAKNASFKKKKDDIYTDSKGARAQRVELGRCHRRP